MPTETMDQKVARIVKTITEKHTSINPSDTYTSAIYDSHPTPFMVAATDFRVASSLDGAVKNLLTLLNQYSGHFGKILTGGARTRKVIYSTKNT